MTPSARALVTGFCSTLIVATSISWALAHSGATGVMKERMDLMKGMGDAMKVMGAMFKNEAPFEPAIVAEKASFLRDHAGSIGKLTPEGSNDHPSEALPAIWQAWSDYVASADELAEESAKLAAIAGDGADLDEARAQYLKLGKTCGSCHDRFRKPKD
ncbi:MAG: c-type cytochrome [Geminicoccaceae bacterium]